MPCALTAILALALTQFPADLGAGVDIAAYDQFVREVFPEVHRRLAHQILTDYGVDQGLALELAFGAPYLSIELARLTLLDFEVIARDSAHAALCQTRIAEAGVNTRFTVRVGRVAALPYPDGAFDLVLARDAMRFWPSKTAALSEIDRVMRAGASALLGGGLGRGYGVREGARFWAQVQDWRNRTNHLPWAASSPYPEQLEAALDTIGLPDFRIWTEGGYCNCRTWVEWTHLPQMPRTLAVPAPAAAQVDTIAPDFTLRNQDEGGVRLADLRGRVILLDFWGVDCRACLNMMQQLRPVLAEHDTGRLRVLAVNIDSDRALFDWFIEQKGDLGFEMFCDDAGVAAAYGIRGLPHFVVVDQQGRIAARVRGSTREHVELIQATLDRLLPD